MANQKQKPKKNVAVRQSRGISRNVPALFDDAFGRGFLPSTLFRGEELWAPAINVIEKDDKFVAKVELPGVNEEDVSVSILGDMMIIEGEKHSDSKVKKKGYSYNETSYGSFSRAIAIPLVVEIDKITANFDKGVLEIDLPKSMDVKPKKVHVTAQKKPKEASKIVKNSAIK